MSWEEAAHNWVQTFVNQCKTGTQAELRLFCEGEHLKVTVCADLGRLTAQTGNFSDCWGVPKCGPSRLRRREKRAAERVAKKAAAENADAKKVTADEVVADKVASEEVVAVKVHEYAAADAEKASALKEAAEKETAQKDAVEKEAADKEAVAKEVPEKDAAEKNAAEQEVAKNEAAENEAEKKEAAEASTSCYGSKKQAKMSCWSCDVMFGDSPAPSSTSSEEVAANKAEEQPSPLPLCLYRCHRGSGKNPVHYFTQCVCSDRVCTCWCYCT